VKSTFRFSLSAIAGTTLSLAVLLALGGCGQPGPLYLPKPPSPKAANSQLGQPGVPPINSAAPSSPPTTPQ
jgi:predicted small lipoprotein YifL